MNCPQLFVECLIRECTTPQTDGYSLGRAHFASVIHRYVFCPTLILTQVYKRSNQHWVLRLLLIAQTRQYLCLNFDQMCDRPHIVGANQEELALVDLIGEREDVGPQQRKRWSKFLDAFSALAFAIAPLHSNFIQQLDGVGCHLACLLTLHCASSWRVVKGILHVPQDPLWLLREMAGATLYFSRSKLASTPRTPAVYWEVARMYPEPKFVDPVDTCFSSDGTPHMVCHECKVLHCALHASILCQADICSGLRQFWTANLATVAVASAVAAAAAAVDCRFGVPTIVAASFFFFWRYTVHSSTVRLVGRPAHYTDL